MAINAIYLGIGGSVIALDRATGDELWRTRLKGAYFVNVTIDGRQIYATANNEIFCLDVSNGEPIWHTKLSSMGWGLISTGQVTWRLMARGTDFNVNVVLDDEQIYVTTKGEIFCLNATSGELLWHNQLLGMGLGVISIATPSGSKSLSAQEECSRDQRDVTSASTA